MIQCKSKLKRAFKIQCNFAGLFPLG